MATTTDQDPSPNEIPLYASLRHEITEGLKASRDPTNANLPDLALRTTTMYSPWFIKICPECHHVFREGDQVRQCPLCGEAYHDDEQYALLCWQRHFGEGQVCRPRQYDHFREEHDEGCPFQPTDPMDREGEHPAQQPESAALPAVATYFLKGMQTVWRPFGDAEVIEVQAGSNLVGRKCHWCRFDVRAGDHVVKCSCGKCGAYFHNDIFRKLTCWNNWNGLRGHDFCPTTGAKIEVPEQPPSDEEGHER